MHRRPRITVAAGTLGAREHLLHLNGAGHCKNDSGDMEHAQRLGKKHERQRERTDLPRGGDHGGAGSVELRRHVQERADTDRCQQRAHDDGAQRHPGAAVPPSAPSAEGVQFAGRRRARHEEDRADAILNQHHLLRNGRCLRQLCVGLFARSCPLKGSLLQVEGERPEHQVRCHKHETRVAESRCHPLLPDAEQRQAQGCAKGGRVRPARRASSPATALHYGADKQHCRQSAGAEEHGRGVVHVGVRCQACAMRHDHSDAAGREAGAPAHSTAP
eukprot:CAMPEP_0179210348 /NCGR_PEP_ID=MMETSP0796-20121207/104911_1 /TAXON_ID=73915 /ORGANISM="Pyrodinium bahamense, Strain pbaha01" /LENGTH=273 /DNA_ID=CAMNT_0020915311 /DNA_START=75 /DNA_END=896 /DNA_ORIENTATION=+